MPSARILTLTCAFVFPATLTDGQHSRRITPILMADDVELQDPLQSSFATFCRGRGDGALNTINGSVQSCER